MLAVESWAASLDSELTDVYAPTKAKPFWRVVLYAEGETLAKQELRAPEYGTHRWADFWAEHLLGEDDYDLYTKIREYLSDDFKRGVATGRKFADQRAALLLYILGVR